MNVTWSGKFELYTNSQILSLYWYIINVINIRWFVYSISIFLPQNIRSCFAHFWARSKSSKYIQQKHGIMAVKRKIIRNLVWQKLVMAYRGSFNKFPRICLKKYFRFISATYLQGSIYGNYNMMRNNWHLRYILKQSSHAFIGFLFSFNASWFTAGFRLEGEWTAVGLKSSRPYLRCA